MSPDTYFYNEEDLERQVIVQDIRHNYGFIFSQIERIFDFYYPDYNKKLSKRAEDIEEDRSGGFGALLFTSSVAAGKLLQLSDPRSPHL